MKNILIIITIILVLGVGGFIYFNKYSTSNMNMSPSNTSTNPNEVIPANNVVIQNYTFTPSNLTIKVGTTVTWTNKDSVPHSIKSTSFNSPDLATGDTFKFTFNTPGAFNYNCGIHPSMTGVIVVQN